jgi:hypothetical protein
MTCVTCHPRLQADVTTTPGSAVLVPGNAGPLASLSRRGSGSWPKHSVHLVCGRLAGRVAEHTRPHVIVITDRRPRTGAYRTPVHHPAPLPGTAD